jgi:hypothetical protein
LAKSEAPAAQNHKLETQSSRCFLPLCHLPCFFFQHNCANKSTVAAAKALQPTNERRTNERTNESDSAVFVLIDSSFRRPTRVTLMM